MLTTQVLTQLEKEGVLPPKTSQGKVRTRYDLKNKVLFLTTDRLSAFDRRLAYIPHKGQVLNQVSNYWFQQTAALLPSYFESAPDPNAALGKMLHIFPIEFVVRGYLTGVTATSVWTAYEKGEREFCGNHLPEGMRKNEAFQQPLLTPTTKDEVHDEKISAAEIKRQGLMSAADWDTCAAFALRLFRYGQQKAAERGLILVDTKYEFGKDEQGNILLADEVHTPDSSRYWLSHSYSQRLAAGLEPENIDKEFLRLWFKQNCDPYKDELLPEPPPELVEKLSQRYRTLYEKITGEKFIPAAGNTGDEAPLIARLKKNLGGLAF